jgi:hypothetical protein
MGLILHEWYFSDKLNLLVFLRENTFLGKVFESLLLKA